MQLTELQKSCWQNIGCDTHATQKIRNLALQYYIQYRQHLKKTNSFIENENKIQNLLLISYFISEKSETVYGINGKKVNIAFSINQLIKKHTDYKDCFFHLKQMMKIITLPQQAKQSQAQINGFMKYFSFVMKFCDKLSSIFDKISICHNIHNKELELAGGQKQYKDKIKYLLWLLFINFRIKLFQNNMDIIGNMCILSSLYTYFVTQMYKVQKIISLYAPDIVQDLGTLPNSFQQVQSQFLNYFSLKDMKTYQHNRKLFLQFINQLSVKYPQFQSPFSFKFISKTINNLEKAYHNQIELQRNKNQMNNNTEMHYIDQTLFLKNLVSNQSNLRFTVFGAKRKIGKFSRNKDDRVLHCRRVLNYDQQIKDNQTTTSSLYRGQVINEKNFFNLIEKKKQPQTCVPLIKATPLNQFAFAYNWLFAKSQRIKQQKEYNGLNLSQFLQIGYQQDKYQLDNQQILLKKQLIEGIFYELLNQYKQVTDSTVNVCAILSLQVFYYVNCITNRDLIQLVQSLDVSWYQLWQCIDKLLNYDKNMPNNVKIHLLLIQTSIVTTYIWKQQKFINSINEEDITEVHKSFFYRILHHMAYQFHFINMNLGIPQVLTDQMLILCQFYIKQISFLMKNMNLDVIIMCSIYGVCRARNLDTKFKNIMMAYKSVNSVDDRNFSSLENFLNQEGQQIDIIGFYNKVFLKHSKIILMKIKEEKLQSDQLINQTNYILSPVKQILSPNISSRTLTQNTPHHSHMLFAYNQSPLLKKSRRMQRYESRQNTKNNENIDDMNLISHNIRRIPHQTQTLRQRTADNNKNINQMIIKKFGNANKTSTLLAKGTQHKKVT